MRISGIFIVASLLAGTASGRQGQIRDEDVTNVVEREFLYDHATSPNDIDVSTQEGVVTLEGRVPNILAKERAVRIAETVKGVRSVVDLVKVEPPKHRSDDEIESDIERALFDDPATDSYEVSVAVDERHATLTGKVDSWTEKRLCEQVAKGVKGVTGVTNSISVSYGEQRSDLEIKQDVAQALRWNPLVDDALVNVEVKDGTVSLTGTVGSAAEKRQARQAGWTRGVKFVEDSGLQVARWARDEDLRKEKYVAKPDDEIRKAVEAAFVHDPRVLSFDVNASVTGGVVTLRGVVDNLKAKRAAENDARNTVGVASVRNHVKVRPVESRTDEAIAEDVRAALTRDPFVERFAITVSVHGGTAYLSGKVDSTFEKSHADDLASRVEGVIEVVNNLDVTHDTLYTYDPWVDPWTPRVFDWHFSPVYTHKSDWRIRRDIEEELFWSPFVDADEVTVTVVDGVATLSGTVGSHMEAGAARDNAYEAGATFVRDELEVD